MEDEEKLLEILLDKLLEIVLDKLLEILRFDGIEDDDKLLEILGQIAGNIA
jgi:hypothetical protein